MRLVKTGFLKWTERWFNINTKLLFVGVKIIVNLKFNNMLRCKLSNRQIFRAQNKRIAFSGYSRTETNIQDEWRSWLSLKNGMKGWRKMVTAAKKYVNTKVNSSIFTVISDYFTFFFQLELKKVFIKLPCCAFRPICAIIIILTVNGICLFWQLNGIWGDGSTPWDLKNYKRYDHEIFTRCWYQ